MPQPARCRLPGTILVASAICRPLADALVRPRSVPRKTTAKTCLVHQNTSAACHAPIGRCPEAAGHGCAETSYKFENVRARVLYKPHIRPSRSRCYAVFIFPASGHSRIAVRAGANTPSPADGQFKLCWTFFCGQQTSGAQAPPSKADTGGFERTERLLSTVQISNA
jgi:hypothetical protein